MSRLMWKLHLLHVESRAFIFFFLKAEFTQSLKMEMHSQNSGFFFKAFLLTTTKKSKCCLSFLIFCVFYKINMETIPTKLWVKFQSHLSWNITIKKSLWKKVKNESPQWNNRKLEQTPFSDSFIGFFFHSWTDQMNSRRKEAIRTIREATHSEILSVVWLPQALQP